MTNQIIYYMLSFHWAIDFRGPGVFTVLTRVFFLTTPQVLPTIDLSMFTNSELAAVLVILITWIYIT
jgi:hypothetical protein